MRLILLLLASLYLYQIQPQPPASVEIPVPQPSVHLAQKPAIKLRRVTAYNATHAQTDATPHIASCGLNRDNQIAVSRDILFATGNKRDMCGVKVKIILDDGTVITGVIWDTMNARYTNTADILMTDYTAAKNFGVATGILVF